MSRCPRSWARAEDRSEPIRQWVSEDRRSGAARSGAWAPKIRRQFGIGHLGSGTRRDLLDGPAIAIRIAEIDEGAPRLHVDVADLDAAPDEFCARGVYVRDHQLETPDRPRPHVGDAGADRDRAGRSGRRQLDESKPLSHGDVDVGVEAGPLGIEGLGAVDVGYGDGYQFKTKVHGPIV